MSAAYCEFYHAGKDPACVAPWKTVKLSRRALFSRIRAIFEPLRKKK